MVTMISPPTMLFFRSGGEGVRSSLSFGCFDWQQACVNNVGQEWCWNWHFLPPEFLSEHESHLIDHLLATYSQHGMRVSRTEFLKAYVLGTVQMFVFGGGGLQLLLKKLHSQGLFETMVPGDCHPVVQCETRHGLKLDTATKEKIVGAEMTRRTLTNCCLIMERHNFVSVWEEWRQKQH